MTIAQGRHGITQPNNPQVLPEHAAKILEWIKTRGGLALWGSVNLSNLGASWTAPVNDEDGHPNGRPHWSAANEPYRVITDAAEVEVTVPLEVKRFRVATRMGAQGYMVKLTDASTRRLRKAVDQAAERTADKQAWYQFDYETQEAVIYVNAKVVPLEKFLEGASDVRPS
jgi:hypothetical protein